VPLQPSRTVGDLEQLRALTGDENGAQRVAWTETWEQARDFLRSKVAGTGAEEEVDEAGNQWFTLPGDSDRALLIGGHMDSVPNGGWLDGCLNVMGGVEVLRRIAEEGRPPVTVRLVSWADEEGARFGRSLFGSSAAAGSMQDQDELRTLRDRDGVALPDALREHGVDLDEALAARSQLENAGAYLELHIEQGPFLEEEGLAVGVVEGIVAIAWSRLTIHGVQDHAGPTPMRIRHDALVAASSVVTGVRGIAREIGGELVTTVGNLTVSPNIVNAIPGKVTLSIDMRDPQDATLDRALPMLDRVVREACEREGVRYELEHYWRVPRTPFDREVVAAVERAAQATGAGHRRILSGAGHDAQYMAAIGPAGMVFVPSRGGRSHCEEEFTGMDDIEHGANTLLGTALELAVTL